MQAIQANINSILLSENCNGPGRLISIHFQGCDLGCKGCYNPHMFSFAVKNLLYVNDIYKILDKYFAMDDTIEGVSFLGGEPIYQIEALLELVTFVKDIKKKSCILFSGFTIEELSKLEEWDFLKSKLDLGVFGRYDENLKTKMGYPSSSNQEVLIQNEKYNHISSFERSTILLYDFKNMSVLQTGYPVINKIFK